MNISASELGINRNMDVGIEFIPQPELPLSTMQMALLAEQWMVPQSTSYNVPLAFMLHGNLNLEAIREVLARIVARHEILRTVYRDGDNGPIQAIAPQLPDLLRTYTTDGEDGLVEAARFEAVHQFDLRNEPPLRVALVEAAPNLSALVLVFHHIAVDGWSIRLLLDELATGYNAITSGNQAVTEDPPLQYADWSAWQREQQATAEAEQRLIQASTRLAQVPMALSLPSPSSQAGERGAEMVKFGIDLNLVTRVEQRARELGMTPYTLLASAYALVISRLGDCEQLVVATPIALRERSELQGTLGCFINTLRLFLDLHPNLAKHDYLHQVKQAMVAALDGRDIPYEQIMHQLVQSGNESRKVRVFFNFDDAGIDTPPLAGLRLTRIDCDRGTAKFDLMLSMVRVKEGIHAGFDYAIGVLEAETARTIPTLFRRALAWLCSGESQALRDFSVVDEAAALALLDLGRGADVPLADLTLDAAVLQIAAAEPTRQAVEAADGQLDFRTLAATAESLREQLTAVGVGRGDRVLVLLPRSIALPVAMLGVLRAAAAYLLLETDLPARRLGEIISDAQPAAIICASAWREQIMQTLADRGSEVALFVAFGSDFQLLRGGAAPAQRVNPSLDDLAYMIYTSGSTGLPKGVMVAHRGIMNYLCWAQASYSVQQGSGAPAVTATAFDATQLTLWAPLLAGRCLHLLPEEGALVRLSEDLVNGCGYSFVKLTPAHLELLAELSPISEQQAGAGVLVVGGEALNAATAAAWRREAPKVRIFNEYGPTETVVGCAVYEVIGSADEANRVPIGRAIWNTRLYVLDRRLDLLPVGVPGELYVAGAGVAWGYWRRPHQTAECFIADPFSESPGAVMYRTGDRVRWRSDGNLEYLGRIDDQLKIRGYRIEPGEIESALCALEGVEQAVVFAMGEGSDRRLAAFITGSLGVSECVEKLSALLPTYLIPDLIQKRERLPLTVNGKLDRANLAALVTEEMVSPISKAESTTRGELSAVDTVQIEALVALWRQLLKQEQVGPETDFFAAGGTSLDAIRLIARLKRAYGATLAFTELAAAPTPKALAMRLFNGKSDPEALTTVLEVVRTVLGQPSLSADDDFFAAGGTSLHAILVVARLKRALRQELATDLVHKGASARGIAERLESDRRSGSPDQGPALQLKRGEALMVSPGEAQFWLDQTLGGETSGYVIQAAIRLTLSNARARLSNSFATLAMRHPLLRTRYQQGAEGVEVKLEAKPHSVISLYHTEDGESLDRKVAAVARRDASRPFDLTRGESCRLSFVQGGEERGVLILSLHHIIADGATLTLLLHDLITLLAGEALPTPPRADYRAYAAWRAARVASVETAQIAYWGKRLADAPCGLEIPGQRPLSSGYLSQGGSEVFTIDRITSIEAERFARQQGATLHALLVSVYALFLQRLTAANDLLIGVPVSDRPEGFEEVAGLFLNTLPLRLAVTGEISGEALLKQTAEGMGELLNNADLPLSRIVEVVNPTRVAGQTPLLQTVFDWREAQISEAQITAAQSLSAEPFPLEVATAPFDLALSLTRGGEGDIVGGFIYNRCLLDASTVASWSRCYVTLLKGLLEASNKPVAQLPAVAEEDLQRVLLRGPVTENVPDLIPLLRQSLIDHAPFVALEGPAGERISYAQLAAQVAAQNPASQRLSVVTSSDPLERVVQAVAAILNGQVLALIDPQLPTARQQQMFAALTALDTSPIGKDAAYVQFTSGTTGKPKGVLLSRAGLANLIATIDRDLQLSPGKRVLQLAAPAFDAWIWEVFSCLGAGATLVVAEPERLAAGEQLVTTLRERKVSHLTITPSVLATLDNTDLPELTTLVTAGEPLSSELVAEWAPGRRMFNAYGPCEATICTSHGLCKADGAPPDIGSPIAGMAVMLVDRNNLPVIPGTPGELMVGGIGVGLGYLPPFAEGDRFVESPLLGGRGYRSGDRARINSDGQIQFLGRDDRQVKIRGVRIELDEVEAALCSLSGIEQASVSCLPDATGRPALAAWITGAAANDVDAVREALAKQLPESMLPAYLKGLPRMPLTATGKIDRNALTEPGVSSADEAALEEDTAPISEQEEQILDLFKSLLSLPERPGRKRSFFTLGGHSLLALRLAALLSEQFEREVPLPQLFANPTAAGLAQLFSDKEAATPCILRTLREGVNPAAYLIHPVDGAGHCYQSLAQAWINGRRIVAVEQGVSFPSLDAMAEAYADAIRGVAGEEPILLAGWSLGALITVAVAADLRQQGCQVKMVLMDATHPDLVKGDDLPAELERAAAAAGADTRTMERVVKNIRIGLEHRFNAISGHASLLRAEARKDQPPLPEDLGWRSLFDGLTIETTPGSHHSLLREGDLTALSGQIEQLWRGEG